VSARREVLAWPLELALVPRADGQQRSFVGELPCDEQAETAGPACDDDRAIGEFYPPETAQAAGYECSAPAERDRTGCQGGLLSPVHARGMGRQRSSPDTLTAPSRVSVLDRPRGPLYDFEQFSPGSISAAGQLGMCRHAANGRQRSVRTGLP
jgi:hypothetical protein